MARLLFLQNHGYPFLGPMYISAALKRAGHDCRLAIGNKLSQFAPVLESYRPDLVGFSVMTGGHNWAAGLAAQIKRTYGIAAVFGGPHPTYYPQFVAENSVDLLVRGEGELAVVEILDRLDRLARSCELSGSGQTLDIQAAIASGAFDGIANVCFKREGKVVEHSVRPLIEDIDTLPWPDRGLYPRRAGGLDEGVQCVLTARGCPYSCSFCFEESMRRLYQGKGLALRIRGVGAVIEECRQLKEQYGAKTIYFADDVFGVNIEWLYEFLESYKQRIGLPFLCMARANIVASDPQYARRLAEAGCRAVFFGIESGNEQIRNKVLNKRLTDRDIYEAADLLHKAGIRFRTYNIMGLPDETLNDALATLEMNIRIKADYPWCSIYAPYPGTSLADYARQRHYLAADFDFAAMSESFFVRSALRMKHIRQLQNLQKFFQTGVLWPWTLPLIRRLIHLPPNPLFTLWFGFVYFLVFLRSENRSFWKTLPFALDNARHLLK